MEKESLNDKLNTAIWIGNALFDRGIVTGSSSNMSFRHENNIYITGSGTCFGRLTPKSFACVSTDGTATGIKPSKEFPIHHALYKKSESNTAVIHTHSMYGTMWSCLKNIESRVEQLFDYTPYLKMLAGTIVTIPYASPGSGELFSLFEERTGDERAYLLMNHGPVVTGKNLMEAFYLIEELEVSARIGWLMKAEKEAVKIHERTLKVHKEACIRIRKQ